VDGRETDIYPGGPFGLITLHVPPGQHQVQIRFGDTPARRLGTALTVVSLGVALALLIWPRVRRARST
jgi:hypothetical protein